LRQLNFILTSSLFSITLSASTYFDDGIKFFQSGEYNKSFAIFSQILEYGNSENDLDFYLGRSAFELGKFNEALFAFDRILIETDDRDWKKINRVKLELARTHLALGEKESAKKMFKSVLNSNPPEIVKSRILSILNSIKENKPQQQKWNIFANLEFGYETNINTQPSNKDMLDYTDNPDIKFDDGVESFYIQEMANIGYTHIFDNHAFIINSGLFGYNQNYIEDSDFDISYISFETALAYKKKSYKIESPLKVENVIYGGNPLLNTYSAGLKGVKYIETEFIKAISFGIFTNYKIKNFISEIQPNSSIFKYGLSVMTKYKDYSFNLRYSTEYENSKDDIAIQNDQTNKIINSIFVKYDIDKIANRYDLSLTYYFRNIVYDNYEAFSSLNLSDGTRTDRYNNVKINLSKNIFIKNLKTDIGFSYIKNFSNHVPAEYENMITSFGVSYIF